MKRTNFILLILLLSPLFFFTFAQRSEVNKGVDQYDKGKFADAEVNFKKGLEEDSKNLPANFNLGDALYKQKRYDDAIRAYSSALAESKNNFEKSKIYHNIGNALLKSKKYKESINAYANSLKLNPNDKDTKYNLSYALSMLKNQKNKKNQNKNDKDNKNQKDQQKNQKQNQKNKQDQRNKQKQNQQNQSKPEQNKTAKQDQLKQQKNKISKKEAERILEALKNNEKNLQKQLRKVQGKPVKNW